MQHFVYHWYEDVLPPSDPIEQRWQERHTLGLIHNCAFTPKIPPALEVPATQATRNIHKTTEHFLKLLIGLKIPARFKGLVRLQEPLL